MKQILVICMVLSVLLIAGCATEVQIEEEKEPETEVIEPEQETVKEPEPEEEGEPVEEPEDEPAGMTEEEFLSQFTAVGTEIVPLNFNGTNQDLSSGNPVVLLLEGKDNRVYVKAGTRVLGVHIEGVNNRVYVPGTEDPKINYIGSDNQVIVDK